MTTRFDWRAVVARVLFSLIVVFAIYNPSGRSYWHWLWNEENGFWPKLTVGLGLLAVHAALWTTTLGVLRWKGVVMVSLILVTGWISLASVAGVSAIGGGALTVVPLLLLAMLYAIALCWSFIVHRLSGVQHVEKVK